jgi:signal transduction histidine kinase/CheY-like chemotaxis protein
MTHFIAIKQDITERKQAEQEREQLLEQVQSQAEQMNQIMQSVPEGILLLDRNGKILIANDKAEEYLARLANVAAGNTLTALGGKALASWLTRPDHGNWHEIRVQNHIFELIPQQVKSGPVSQGWVLVLREVTEQKRIEEQLHRQERLAAIGQVAAGIAHDFNNLMAVILLYADLLARSPHLDAKEKGQLKTINQQAKRAARLIEQILDFSRRAVFERRPLDLLSLLKEEIKMLQRTLPENIELELDYTAENFIVQADVTRIQQTIMNLAFNARDAMPEGGRLRFGLSPLSFDRTEQAPLPMMQPGSWVHLSVTDTGTGIDPTVLDHIFEPFVTTKEPGKGTGLGLSQVHGIVAQHKGFITVQSEPGAGTTFELYLPAMTLEGDAFVPALPETAVYGQGQRLLVVEDEPALRDALVESLTLLQYDVIETANGAEALALLEEGTAVDLIICDVIMPKMGGIPFVQALQKQKSPPPVIFITGHPLDISSDSLQEMGVHNVLTKPIQASRLSQAIAAALNLKK